MDRDTQRVFQSLQFHPLPTNESLLACRDHMRVELYLNVFMVTWENRAHTLNHGLGHTESNSKSSTLQITFNKSLTQV